MFSVVVLTYNSARLLKSCLDSLLNQSYQRFEVIVVDNGSSDETISLLKEGNYPNLTIVSNETNLGACRARNQGIELAQNEWILTLDCDIILPKDFLYNISRFLLNIPQQVAMVQPKIMNQDGHTIYSCGIFLSPCMIY